MQVEIPSGVIVVATTAEEEALSAVVAWAGLALGVTNLVVGALYFWLTGARVIVRLNPVQVDAWGSYETGPEKGWDDPRWRRIALPSRIGRWCVDLAAVRVTNAGRHAISVSNIALDLGRVAGGGWRQFRARRTVRPIPVNIAGASNGEVVRLEAGDSMVVYFDLWSILRPLYGDPPSEPPWVVRGTAQPAGRWRVSRSPRRRRWRIRPEQERLRDPLDPIEELRVYRMLWEQYRTRPGNVPEPGEAPSRPSLGALEFRWMQIVKILRSSEDPTSDLARIFKAMEDEANPESAAVSEIFANRLATEVVNVYTTGRAY